MLPVTRKIGFAGPLFIRPSVAEKLSVVKAEEIPAPVAIPKGDASGGLCLG